MTWLGVDLSHVSSVILIAIVLGVVHKQCHVMSPYIFPLGLRINAAGYIEVLKTC